MSSLRSQRRSSRSPSFVAGAGHCCRRARLRLASAAALVLFATGATAVAAPCEAVVYDARTYTVCRFDAAKDDLRLFHSDKAGKPLRTFEAAADLLEDGESLAFAMNAGMYHEDRSPVGLLTIAGRELAPLNRGRWLGNFYLKPNGVFYLADGRAGVLETGAYAKSGLRPAYATQSGPMLVIGGKLHPRFLVNASSKNIRNGVGVSADGRSVIFAISETPVTFHAFGVLFRDVLRTPNALYLDGSISRLHAPNLARSDGGEDMGPIIGAVTARPAKSQEGQNRP